MVGTWRGTVTTPWVEPYEVEIIFKKDGNYESRSLTTTSF